MKKRVLSLFLAVVLCLSLLPTAGFAEGFGMSDNTTIGGDGGSTGGGVLVDGKEEPGGGVYEDTRTEIWCVSKPDSIGRSYDGTTDGSTVPITLTFTDGTNTFELKEGSDFTAVKAFDSADAGWHTVTVEITLSGETANKYKLREGEEKFTIGGNINKAYPKLAVSLSKTTCAVDEKLLPLLSVEGAPEDAEVTYYYLAAELKNWAGSSDVEGSEFMPKIDENTAISETGTYYVYAKTAETKNYKEERSTTVELTVAEKVDPVVSVLAAGGTQTDYASLPEAMKAAQNGDTVRLLADATLSKDGMDIEKSLTLDLNGYVLGSDGSLTVKNGAALTVTNAGGEKSEEPVKVGLYLTLLVEKGGSFTCTDGSIRYLGLQNADTGGYSIKLAEGESHCAFGGFAQGDVNATIGDLLKATPGMALYGADAGSYVRIERSTRINSGFTYFSFYVGPCSEHQIGEDGTCAYCGASYVASVTPSGGKTTNYTSLDTALDAVEDGDTLTLLTDVDVGSGLKIDRGNITFHLNGHKLYSTETSGITPILSIETDNGAVTLKNGTIETDQTYTQAIYVWMPDGELRMENITAKVPDISNQEAVYLGGGGLTATIVSGDYWGLYLDHTVTAVLEGGTFRPYKKWDGSTRYSIFHQLSNSGDSSRDCMELLADGCVYVNEAGEQVRTYGSFDYTVTVKKASAQPTEAVAIIGGVGGKMYPSLREAIKAVKGGETITLLKSLDLGSGVVQLEEIDKDFTIDLGSKELKANAQCLVYMTEGNGHVTIQNGTLDGSSCASQTIFVRNSSSGSPKLTLKNVIATSGNKLPVVQVVAGGTVEFDGGSYTGGVLIGDKGNAVLKSGTFQKGDNTYSIKTEVSGKHLSDYLDSESLFWNGDTLLNLSSETQTADEVTVRPCEHNWVDGKCAICQKVCDHGSADGKSMTSDSCPTCGMKAAAQVDITGSATKYFPNFTDALVYATPNNGCTLKLLADVTDAVSINTPFIFDLNGHDINMLSVGARAKIRDSGTTKGIIKELKVFNIVDADGNETILTVADLLEEGYAFKSSSGNTWYFETVNAISDVTVQSVPIKSVTAENPTVTAEYGKTSGVTLAATVVSATKGGTVSCQWYEIGGTALPIEGATDSTYQLPADLGAGKHTYRLTATSDGYPKSVDIIVNVTPISLEGATVAVKNPTYNGKEQRPEVTVTLGGKTLTSNDFSVYAPKQTEAGSYKLTVSGVNNYSGKIENVEWKIEPMKIDSVLASSDISKVYDGTAIINKTAEEWANVLTFKTLSPIPTPVSVPSDAYTISDAYFVEKSGEETIHSPDAGEKYGITFKITLNSNNYVLQTHGEDTPSTSKEITQSGAANFTIEQATVTLPDEITQLVFNDLAKTYEIELKTLLPELAKPCEYGDITSGNYSVSLTNSDYYDTNAPATVINGVLRLPIKAASSAKSEIGTVKVELNPTNYKSFELTLHIIAQDKIPPDQTSVTVSASDITYGQTLAGSTLTATGSMICPRMKAEIPGTFAWTDGTIKPNAGDYTASWTFTPAEGYEEYAPATGTVTVKVKPATLLNVSVLVPGTYYYTGEPQRAGVIAAGQGVCGESVTFTYSTEENGTYTSQVPAFTDAGTYTAYYKAEAANHEPATGTFTVTIDPLPISLLSVSSISKTYDGSADVTLTADKLTFISKTAKASNIKLPDTALTISNASFTKKQDDGSYLPSPEVGGGKALSFTMTLKSDNYVLEREPEGTKTISSVFDTDDTTRFTITKGTAPEVDAVELIVYNDLSKTYTLDLSEYLPQLANDCKYGSIEYKVSEFGLTADGYKNSTATFTEKDGQYKLLTLNVPAVDSQTEGPVGTVGVKITTDNYQDMLLTVNVTAKNKIVPVPDGEITATPITFGQILRVSTITGTMKDGDKTVEGTFEWTNPSIKPNAGDYEASWTFTPAEGYEQYATATGTVTVTVDRKDIAGAKVTLKSDSFEYDGTRKDPEVASVILDGITLIGGATSDYGYHYDMASDVGKYNLTVSGNHNYTGKVTVQWSITPRTVEAPDIELNGDCTYTGSKIEPTVTVKDDLVNTIDPKEYEVSYSNNTNAGTAATVTVTDKEGGNYVLGTASTTFEIGKATAPAAKAGELTITNGLHKTYSLDLSTLLPNLTAPCDYGSITYDKKVVTNLGTGSFITLVNGKTGELTLEANRSGKDEGQFGTITVTVTTGNYQDITLTINVSAENKITPQADGAVTATDITYGQALNDSKITGKMKDPTSGEEITGTFTWTDGTIKPNASENYQAEWKFTPADQEKYAEVTGTVTIKVNKAATTGEPKYTKITTGGKTLKDAALTTKESTLKPNAGKLEWVDDKNDVLPDDTKVEANTTYKWRFTPTDTNYTTLTGEIELYHRSSGGGGGVTAPSITVPVSSEQETVKVDATVSGSTASVEVTDKQLDQVTSGGDTVTVDVSGLKGVDSAKLPSSIVEKVGQTETELTVVLPTGSVALDAKALAAIEGTGDVTVSVRPATLTDAQREIVGTLTKVAAVVDVKVMVGTVEQTGFDGGRLTIAIPYTPKAGEDTARLTVWFLRDDGSIEDMGGRYDAETGCFVFQTDHLSRYLLVDKGFVDVPATAYYADAVAWAAANGITSGTDATHFAPNGICTRAQAVTFLWRAAGSPAPVSTTMPYTDVPAGSYYHDAVLWAVEKGITKGTSDTTFSPNATCTRAQIVTFLWRAEGAPAAGSSDPFTDVKSDAYYADAVLWAVAEGITKGTTDTAFSPNDDCTRAQIVTFLWRCMK